MRKIIPFLFLRTWLLYACLGTALFFLFKPIPALDDLLNDYRADENNLLEFSFGLVPFDKGQFLRAVGYYKILVTVNPWIALAQADLGFCYFYLKDIPKAIEFYRKAIDTDPGIYSFYFDLGFIYQSRGDYTRAVDLFERARQVFPKNHGEFLNALHISPKYKDQPLVQEGSILFKRMEYDRSVLDSLLAWPNLKFIPQLHFWNDEFIFFQFYR